MEVDSYFVLVREGSGSFIINGEEFPCGRAALRGSNALRC